LIESPDGRIDRTAWLHIPLKCAAIGPGIAVLAMLVDLVVLYITLRWRAPEQRLTIAGLLEFSALVTPYVYLVGVPLALPAGLAFALLMTPLWRRGLRSWAWRGLAGVFGVLPVAAPLAGLAWLVKQARAPDPNLFLYDHEFLFTVAIAALVSAPLTAIALGRTWVDRQFMLAADDPALERPLPDPPAPPRP
jgi:hypothetical protein